MKNESRETDQSASNQSANSDKKAGLFKRPGRFSLWIISLTILSILTLSVILAYNFIYLPYSYLKSLPTLDLTGIEEQLTDKIQKLRKEVEKNPGSAAAWGNLAMILDIHDLKSEAIPCYKQAAALDPTDFRWSYFCAIILHEMGETESLDWFELSKSLNPDYIPIYVRYGQALFNFGQFEESSQAYEQAIAKDSKASYAYLSLAKNALSQGNLPGSQQYLQKSLDIEPKQREAHELLAQVYRRLNQQEKATAELRTAQEQQRTTSFADSVYEKLIEKGASALWYRERGLAFLSQGLYENAIHEFQKALKIKPDPTGHNHIGELLLKNNNYADAAQEFRSAIAINPYYYEAQNNLSRALFELGQVEGAIEWAIRSIGGNPRLPNAYITLGDFYKHSKSTAEAIAILRRGMRATRNYPPITLRLARILAASSEDEFRNGQEAVRLAKFVCEYTVSQKPEALDVLATAYAETGQFGKAVRTAQEALSLIDTTKQKELTAHIENHIKLFKANKPYREE